jgi:hypothetical protein
MSNLIAKASIEIDASVAYALEAAGRTTKVTLTQDGNDDDDARDHAEKNWKAMLAKLKAVVETPAPARA